MNKELRYHDTESRLKCPCCGKDLYTMKMSDETLEQLLSLTRNNPEDAQEIMVGLFAVMHNPEKGTPVEELDGTKEG